MESDNSQDSEILARTDFTFSDIEVFRNQEFLLASNLIDDLGNPMFNQHVNVTFNGKKYPVKMDKASAQKLLDEDKSTIKET